MVLLRPILGEILLNFSINYLFYFKTTPSVYNFVDDKHLDFCGNHMRVYVNILDIESLNIVDLLDANKIKLINSQR